LLSTLLVVLIFLSDVVSGGYIRTHIRAGASRMWGYVAQTENAVGLSGFFSSRRALEAQIVSLKAQIDETSMQRQEYSIVQQENQRLRSLIKLATSNPGISAPIVSSFHSSPYGTFMIGAGTSNTLQRGDLVLAGDNLVIGRIVEVGTDTSLVAEIFAPGATIDAHVGSTPVSIVGQGGGNAKAQMPRGVNIQAGDIVTVPAYGDRAIGVVGHVESDAGSASQSVYVGLPINENSLELVYVMRQN
jgi:cell shape-determining protein MreC